MARFACCSTVAKLAFEFDGLDLSVDFGFDVNVLCAITCLDNLERRISLQMKYTTKSIYFLSKLHK